MELFTNLDPTLRIFWIIASISSIIFIIQTIMSFMGADAQDGIDVDFDGDFEENQAPFQLFSLRNLINFLLGFSWTGISFFNTIHNLTLLIFLSVAVGIVFILLFFIIIKQLQKLAEDNSFKIANTLNKTGEVYLTIPENKTGKGKVLVSVNGAVHELEAMSETGKIDSGSVIKVVKIEGEKILIVEPV